MWKNIKAILGIAAVGTVSYVVYKELTQNADKTRTAWESKREEVSREIEQQNIVLNRHLQSKNEFLDFNKSVNLYRKSVIASNIAYKALQDARSYKKFLSNALLKLRRRRTHLLSKTQLTPDEGKELVNLTAHMLPIESEVKEQTEKENELLKKVRIMNNHTHQLKIRIRDDTGQLGLEWFTRLEERKKLNLASK